MSHSQVLTPSTAFKALSQAEENSIASEESEEIPPWVIQINLTRRNKEGVEILIKNDKVVP